MGDARTHTVVRRARPRCPVPAVRRRVQAPERAHPAAAARLLQPALRVGAANDPLEREAEQMAERVVAMPAPAPAPPAAEPGGDAGSAAAGAARRFPKIDQESQPDTTTFDSAPPIPADHQDPTVPKTEDVDTAGLQQDEFGEIAEGEPTPPVEDALQAAPDGPAVGAEGGPAPRDVAHKVAQPGAGRPLPATVRAFMEPRFGLGFGDVRIHDGAEDRRAADRIGARAFTHREHIWMGAGESVEDRRLMAHELTHVVQQTRRPSLAAEDAAPAQRAAEPQIRRGWLRNKAERVARNVPGYFLMTVILGKSPITGNRVPRTAENLIGGFLGLLPGGNLIFERLKETRALQNAFDWVSRRLSELNITWARIKGLVSDFIDEMPSLSPIKDAKRIFGPLVEDIITFVGEIKDKILEFIIHGALKLAGSWGDRVWEVIQQARETISLILNDPLGFAKNLVRAVVGGFQKFGKNIWKHIKSGLMAWLFGTLQGMEIQMPQKLDFKGILSVALQIVGLTYANFRKILVKKLGRGGERKVAFLERSVEVVQILVRDGFVGIWQRVLEAIEGFKTTVIDGIRDFVIGTIINGALSWIAGLSNPVGAIVKVALSIYNMIKTFLERMEQIIELVSSIFSSIGAIARGQIAQAVDFIETTIARTIPVFLAFVAALVPVTGITNTIRGIFKKLKAPVKRAMEKLVTFFVKKAKKLFSKILGKVNRKRKLARHGFRIGEAAHALIPEQAGNSFVLKIASGKPRKADQAQAEMKGEGQKATEFGDDSKCVEAFKAAFQLEIDEAEAALKKVKPAQQKTSTKKPADKATAETADAGQKLSKLGPCIADNPFFEDKPQDGAIIRAREPRIAEIEGDAGLYTDRGNVTSKAIETVGGKAGLGARGKQRLSNYYENDHIPEKSLGFAIQEYVQGDLKAEIAEGERDGSPIPDPNLGDIDTRPLGKKGEQLPAITVYRPAHRQKTAADAKRTDHKKIIAAAKAKSSPLEKIAALRAGIQAEMDTELSQTADLYSADKAATKQIRGKLRAGMRDLGTLNKALFGFEPGKPPKVKRGGSDAPGGSDLPMEGDPTSGLPDFADLEGLRTEYKAKPKNVGNYLEYDHVVEATLAEKARDLTLGDAAFRGGLDEQVKARAAEQAAAEAKTDGDKGRTAAEVEKRAKGRLASLDGPAFTGGARSYDRERAGTVALYRPVHREVTAAQQGVKGPIVTDAEIAGARTKLLDYAVSNPSDTAMRKSAVADLQTAVRGKFEAEIAGHTAKIRDAYVIELKDFMALNRSKQAAAKMQSVVERVADTLRTLRRESLDLLK
ncbi:MAG: DUF4157 domain-containing protein [Rhodobacteraceae bacterium]|nr:DUF4157 domain-containing protein [Paracoccaceae bacterium]